MLKKVQNKPTKPTTTTTLCSFDTTVDLCECDRISLVLSYLVYLNRRYHGHRITIKIHNNRTQVKDQDK